MRSRANSNPICFMGFNSFNRARALAISRYATGCPGGLISDVAIGTLLFPANRLLNHAKFSNRERFGGRGLYLQFVQTRGRDDGDQISRPER